MDESLKEKAVSFLRRVASGDVRQAYEEYVGPNFIHHNPYFKGDAESLMLGMEESAKENPNKIFEVKLVIEDGDYVAVHSHIKQSEADRGGAVVHIFRFSNDLIAELWDVGQQIPENSSNEYGMFKKNL